MLFRSLVLSGETPTAPGGTTAPAMPTMGLAASLISMLEQFAPEIETGEEVYRFASSRDPRTQYEVAVVNGTATCSCPGFHHGATCWHVKAVINKDFSKAVTPAR